VFSEKFFPGLLKCTPQDVLVDYKDTCDGFEPKQMEETT